MPLSRQPKKRKRHSAFGRTTPHIPYGEATIEGIFDRAKLARRGGQCKVMLYHYTTLQAAESIIASQRFRATAHDCTNDEAELTSADSTIAEALSAAQSRTSGLTAQILRSFSDSYATSRIGAAARTYLICFSQARDDPHQWCAYGAKGEGVCLGLRLFEIPEPRTPELSTQFMPVQYDPAEWRSKIDDYLDAFIAGFEKFENSGQVWDVEHATRAAFGTLNIATGAWALTSKKPEWRNEHEMRMIFLVRQNMHVQPETIIRTDGTVKRFITVPVTRLKRMPVEEIIVGPEADYADYRERLLRALTCVRYRNAGTKIVRSKAVVQCD